MGYECAEKMGFLGPLYPDKNEINTKKGRGGGEGL
jgi:hypothetical protein